MKNCFYKHAIAATTFSAIAFFSAIDAEASPLSISQVPLYLGGTVEPNILFVLDDSGSMEWSFMPDGIYGYYNTRRAKSSTFNKIYYDPAITYTPPLDQNGVSLGNASFSGAWYDGYDIQNRNGNKTDLRYYFRPTWYYPGYSTAYSGSAEPAYYYEYSSICGNTSNDNCYTKRVVVGTSQEQNFANWYSYYRNRMYTAKAGVSRAFGIQGTGMRVGYGRINKSSGTIDGVSTSTLDRGVRDFSDEDSLGNPTGYRTAFFNWLFQQQPTGSTPLRRALDAAGDYFERSDSQGPASTTPGVSGGNDLSCRQNFTILTTDGYWTEGTSYQAATSGARQNNDATDGLLITGPNNITGQFKGIAPFKDSYSNTLADIAAYYWKRDLRTDLTNNVPTSSDDPAFWQHMVTFGVGLGVTGSIDPATAFAAIGTNTDPGWINPTSTDAAKIDDLLHAALNSRGQFFSAGDPNTFASALAATLATINARTSSAATVSSNSTRLSTNTLVFQALFDSGDWSGDMKAFEIEQDPASPAYLQPKVTPTWTASTRIPSASLRNLLTFDPGSGNGVPFKWASLSAAQRVALGSSALLDWIRGDQSAEVTNGGPYRNRNSIMGDVINSSPAYAGKLDYGYGLAASLTTSERQAYRSRLSSTSYLNRKGVLLFGANDGIFRGLDADTGNELFGYVPNAILSGLADLADPDYTHRYYVDGSPRIADARIGGTWKTVAISSTGAGGKSYFALSLENVLTATPRQFNSNDVLWEVSNTTIDNGSYPYAELGVTIGQAAIGRTESGQWVAIIGNGYNSVSQTARLFVIDLATGKRLLEIDTGVGDATTPNGMATPLAVDSDQNGSIDIVYAGDLRGNLWKFDFTSHTANTWKLAFNGKPLFKAIDAGSNAQPITTKPTAGFHPDGGLMVYFGTGKYFETGDNTNLSAQSIYGVRDECGLAMTGSGCASIGTASKVARSNLLQQTISYQGTQSFNGNSWEIRQFSQNSANSTQKGFFVDLAYNGNLVGERILATPILWSDRIIYVSAIPDDDACSGGGDSWIIELSPFEGARTDFSVFDLARDGSYGESSYHNNQAVNARKVIGGMIGGDGGLGQINAGDGRTVKLGSTASGRFDTSVQQSDGGQRISWRQIQ